MILVIGGAGYIGSHVVKLLRRFGKEVLVLDDLSTGRREALLGASLIEGDFGNPDLLRQIFQQYSIDTVFHFAAFIDVEDSVKNPMAYYRNNGVNLGTLLEACVEFKVPRFIYSSSASVYGEVQGAQIPETYMTNPVSPYGRTKLLGEWLVNDVGAATGMSTVCLRYFNVAGADPDGQLGQYSITAKHLIKTALQVALGRRHKIEIFGTDYPTPDGTAVRDFIHVSDLADAHLKAYEYITHKKDSLILNCGYGQGYSVLEVINAVEKVTGIELNKAKAKRREGDPVCVVADNHKIKQLLNWRPQYNNLEFIIKTAYDWELSYSRCLGLY